MEELLEHGGALIQYDWSIFFKMLLIVDKLSDRVLCRIKSYYIYTPAIT